MSGDSPEVEKPSREQRQSDDAAAHPSPSGRDSDVGGRGAPREEQKTAGDAAPREKSTGERIVAEGVKHGGEIAKGHIESTTPGQIVKGVETGAQIVADTYVHATMDLKDGKSLGEAASGIVNRGLNETVTAGVQNVERNLPKSGLVEGAQKFLEQKEQGASTEIAAAEGVESALQQAPGAGAIPHIDNAIKAARAGDTIGAAAELAHGGITFATEVAQTALAAGGAFEEGGVRTGTTETATRAPEASGSSERAAPAPADTEPRALEKMSGSGDAPERPTSTEPQKLSQSEHAQVMQDMRSLEREGKAFDSEGNPTRDYQALSDKIYGHIEAKSIERSQLEAQHGAGWEEHFQNWSPEQGESSARLGDRSTDALGTSEPGEGKSVVGDRSTDPMAKTEARAGPAERPELSGHDAQPGMSADEFKARYQMSEGEFRQALQDMKDLAANGKAWDANGRPTPEFDEVSRQLGMHNDALGLRIDELRSGGVGPENPTPEYTNIAKARADYYDAKADAIRSSYEKKPEAAAPPENAASQPPAAAAPETDAQRTARAEAGIQARSDALYNDLVNGDGALAKAAADSAPDAPGKLTSDQVDAIRGRMSELERSGQAFDSEKFARGEGMEKTPEYAGLQQQLETHANAIARAEAPSKTMSH